MLNTPRVKELLEGNSKQFQKVFDIPFPPNFHYVYTSTEEEFEFDKLPVEFFVNWIQPSINKGVKLILFDNSSESLFKSYVDRIEDIISQLNYTADVKFFFATAALNAPEAYAEYCSRRNVKQKIIMLYANTFELYTKWFYEGYLETAPLANFIIKQRPKKFLCFNKVARNHRVALLAKLLENNLINDSYISFGKGDGNNFIDNIDTYPEIIQQNKHIFPLVLNIAGFHDNPAGIKFADTMYYRNSYFSVVTETCFYTDDMLVDYVPGGEFRNTLNSVFFTEKTYKPIVMKHPFIIVGRYNSLHQLRKLGYKTYSPFIDETYDLIKDDNERLNTIVTEINRLSTMSDLDAVNWLQGVKSIADYNHNVFMSRKSIFTNMDKLKKSLL